MRKLYSLFFAALLLLTACDSGPEFEGTLAINMNNLYPSDFAYDAVKRQFIIGSVKKGKLLKVDEFGKAGLYMDDYNIVSAFGVAVDPKTNLLMVCNSDSGLSEKSQSQTRFKTGFLHVYSLEDKSQRGFYDLGSLAKGRHLLNDIAVGKDGDVFVTDSKNASIYKVNTLTGKYSKLVTDKRFRTKSIGISGVVFHPKGYLILTKADTGQMFTLNLETKKVTNVSLPNPLKGLEKIVYVNKKTIIGLQRVSHGAEVARLVKIVSKDQFKTAVIKPYDIDLPNEPSSIIVINKYVYILDSNISKLRAKKSHSEYGITKQKI